jgi:hypothetical protein
MSATMKKGADIEIFPQKTDRADRLDGMPAATLTGRITAVSRDDIMIDFPGSPHALAAKTIIDIQGDDIGRNVLLSFENGDRRRPVILGLIRNKAGRAEPPGTLDLEKEPIAKIQVDGERLLISAEKEVVIQCGQASLIMTRDGKVVIKGTKIVSRSKGINKIKGAAVSIN